MKYDHLPLYDFTNLKNQIGNDDVFLHQMVALFITQTSEQLEKIRKAFQEKNTAEILFIMHKMKSSITIFGIKSLQNTIHETERMIPNNFDETALAENLATIENVLQQCIDQLKVEYKID